MNATTMIAQHDILQDLLFSDDNILNLLSDLDDCAPETGFCVVIRFEGQPYEVFGNSNWEVPARDVGGLTDNGALARLEESGGDDIVAILVDPAQGRELGAPQRASLAAIALDLVARVSSALKYHARSQSFDMQSLQQALAVGSRADCVA